MKRLRITGFVILTLLASICALAVVMGAFLFRGPSDSGTWAAAAASLAVFASLIAASTTQSLVELEKLRQRPNPRVFLDFESRQGLALLSIENFGLSPAGKVAVQWETPILDQEGRRVGWGPDQTNTSICALLPRERLSCVIGSTPALYQSQRQSVFSGKIMWEDEAGCSGSTAFNIDINAYAHTPTDSTEAIKAYHEVQKIPVEIQKLSGAVNSLRTSLEKGLAR